MLATYDNYYEWRSPMGSVSLCALENIQALVSCVHESDEPVVVLDGQDECLVAMRPAVLERILFDTDLLNRMPREELHL